MLLPVLAALTCGAFASTMALWLFGFGGETASETAGRLSKLRNGEAALPAAQTTASSSVFKVRRPKSVNFGGITVVSGQLSTKWTRQLDRAGLTLNAKEYFILRIAVAIVAGFVGMVLLPVPILGLLAAPIGFLVPAFYVKIRISSRLKKMESQLIEMLQMVSSGLRAGFGLQQALEASSEQIPDPLAVEIKRCMRDISMGSSVEAALTNLNERVGSSDFDIVITAILIQRTVGGNLAEILDNVAHTMRERERIRGEIRTLTSQQRLTGFVIGGIPFALFGAMYVINKPLMSLLFTEPAGKFLIIGALVLEAMGAFVIKKIVDIEV